MRFLFLFLIFVSGCFAEDILLVWEANSQSENIYHYNVYKQGQGGQWILIGQTQDPMFYEYDVAYERHIYYVSAINVWGEGNPSQVVDVRVKRSPPGGGKPNKK